MTKAETTAAFFATLIRLPCFKYSRTFWYVKPRNAAKCDYFLVFFLPQRFSAASRPIWLRCSAVSICMRRLPPVLPPLRPIAAITWETKRMLTVTDSVWPMTESLSPTDSRTTRRAFWDASSPRSGRLAGVPVRFGICPAWHESPQSVKRRQVFQTAPLPNQTALLPRFHAAS